MKSLSITKQGKQRISVLIAFIFLILGLSLQAQNIPEPPQPPRLVNDFANLLSTEEVNQLERKLVNYNDTTSTQLLVVIVPDLEGYDVADYTFKLGEKWGVGTKGQNNGAVILIKPKTERAKGKAYIATGYGLEAVIPDALAKRIVENEMIPEFRQGNYYQGINKAVDTMMGLASGLYTAEQYNDKGGGGAAIVGLIILIIVIVVLSSSKNNHTNIGSGSGGSLWTALWLASMAGRGGSGSFGNFSGGSGGFGGGGGGFGGFGGGSFGGGGAGGSW